MLGCLKLCFMDVCGRPLEKQVEMVTFSRFSIRVIISILLTSFFRESNLSELDSSGRLFLSDLKRSFR